MALKRPKGPAGTLLVLEHSSKILKDNPWRVPHARRSRAPRLLRKILRRLRRDSARDEVREDLGRDRGSLRRRVFRFRLLARLAEHAERARQAPPARAKGRRL